MAVFSLMVGVLMYVYSPLGHLALPNWAFVVLCLPYTLGMVNTLGLSLITIRGR